MLEKAKELLFNRWTRELDFLRTRPKCKDYGKGETVDSLWDKLPSVSKQYWLTKSA